MLNLLKKIINSSREIREVLAVDLNACNNYKDGAESLKKIIFRTFCFFGDLDNLEPIKGGLKMSDQINNSEAKIISDCGHMIIFEKAFEMREIAKNFLQKKQTQHSQKKRPSILL